MCLSTFHFHFINFLFCYRNSLSLQNIFHSHQFQVLEFRRSNAVRTDLRQPAAANKIIDNFDIIVKTTNIVDLILIASLLLKSKAYFHFIPSTQL